VSALISAPSPTLVAAGTSSAARFAPLREALPTARIHVFEPRPELAARLREVHAHDERLIVHAATLAAEDALLPAGSDASAPDVLALALGAVVTEPIDLLELDLQGRELEALRDWASGSPPCARCS
jgi:hypothetical protein